MIDFDCMLSCVGNLKFLISFEMKKQTNKQIIMVSEPIHDHKQEKKKKLLKFSQLHWDVFENVLEYFEMNSKNFSWVPIKWCHNLSKEM